MMQTDNIASLIPEVAVAANKAATCEREASVSDNTSPMFTALVSQCDDKSFMLEIDNMRFPARCAFSCLVAPQAGDRVAVMEDTTGHCYILHVLERQSQDITVQVPGNLTFKSSQGAITLAAHTDVNFAASKSCSLLAGKIGMVAERADIAVQSVTASGRELTSTVASINVVARSVTTVADYLMQQARNSVRSIEMLDRVSAGEMITSVKKLFSLRSKQTMLTAEQDVKIDGERIHMG